MPPCEGFAIDLAVPPGDGTGAGTDAPGAGACATRLAWAGTTARAGALTGGATKTGGGMTASAGCRTVGGTGGGGIDERGADATWASRPGAAGSPRHPYHAAIAITAKPAAPAAHHHARGAPPWLAVPTEACAGWAWIPRAGSRSRCASAFLRASRM